MYGLYTPILILQAFCIYHAYRRNAEQRWFWLIALVPVAGSIIYLFYTFSNRQVISSLAESVRTVVNSNHRIKELEKAYQFSDTFTTKLNLADAYVEVERYREAIELYEGCLQGFMSEDPAIRMKLLRCFFLNGDYQKAVELGAELENEKLFRNSEERIAYAWSLFHAGIEEQATRVFESLDIPFTNHYHRLQYCKFLLMREKPENAKHKLEALVAESHLMQPTERRLKKEIMHEARELLSQHFAET